jgi:ubiquinone/menaquinone biosynthesis C-methylase UbiE
MAKEPSTSVPPAGSAPKTSDYAMGSTDRERQRLMQQGAVLRGFLASAFRAAGIGPGMRILDLGCGVGDVAMLAADLAGPTGSVVGIDRDPASVAWANKRVADVGYANIRFQTTEFQDFADSEPFDALVGRFILMYLPDPAATLRHLSKQLRLGAVIAFMEPDFTVDSSVFPEMAEFKDCGRWVSEALRHSGARIDMGMRLYATYRDAGFVKTATEVTHLSGCGCSREMADFFAETIRSILPKIIQYGIATPEEVQIDTLADRMDAACRSADPQWVGSRYISAWARKP